MSHNEMINAWNSDNLIGEELSDDELADVQGGHIVVNFGGIYAPITTQIQIQVAAGNFGSQIYQIAHQYA
jgi:hypothetical protein